MYLCGCAKRFYGCVCMQVRISKCSGVVLVMGSDSNDGVLYPWRSRCRCGAEGRKDEEYPWRAYTGTCLDLESADWSSATNRAASLPVPMMPQRLRGVSWAGLRVCVYSPLHVVLFRHWHLDSVFGGKINTVPTGPLGACGSCMVYSSLPTHTNKASTTRTRWVALKDELGTSVRDMRKTHWGREEAS